MRTLDIPTALTETEAFRLQELAKGKVCLEIGALLGYSTITLADVAKVVYSIDPHCGYPKTDPRPTLVPFLANLIRYGVFHKVKPLVGTAQEILPILFDIEWVMPLGIEFAFIDVTGEYEDTWYCLNNVNKLLSENGWMAVHDMGRVEGYDCSGATEAAQDFLKMRGEGATFICDTTLFIKAKNL